MRVQHVEVNDVKLILCGAHMLGKLVRDFGYDVSKTVRRLIIY